jgi:flagellar hook-length control protein FliK
LFDYLESNLKVATSPKDEFISKNLLLKFGLGLKKAEGKIEKVVINSKEKRLPGEQFLLRSEGSESSESNLKIFLDKTTIDAKGDLCQRDLMFKLDLNSKKVKAVFKNSTRDLVTKESTSKLEFDPQNIKAITTKIKAFNKNFLSDKVSKIESDNGDSGHWAPNSQSSDKIPQAILPTKETEPFQKPLQTGVLTQIVERAVLNLKRGKTSIKISLKPEFLGHLRINVSNENHQVMVRILTEIPLVKEIIENNLHQLKTALQHHGLEIDKFDVFIAHDSEQYVGGYENSAFLKMEGETDEEEADGVLTEESEETIQFTGERREINLIDLFI